MERRGNQDKPKAKAPLQDSKIEDNSGE